MDLNDEILAENELAALTDKEVIFNPNITSSMEVRNKLCVFQDTKTETSQPQLCRGAQIFGLPNNQTVYIEGESLHENTEQGQAAGGAWITDNHPKNYKSHVSRAKETRLQGCIEALIKIIKTLNPHTELTVLSSS